MTKNNKINTLYLPKYAPEQAKAYYKGQAEGISIRKLIQTDYTSHELQQAIIQQDYKSTLQQIRAAQKKTNSGKYALISYTAEVYIECLNEWRSIEEVRKYSGYYDNIKAIKKINDFIRERNNNDRTRNLKIKVEIVTDTKRKAA